MQNIFFRLKKEIDENTIKSTTNLFRLKKENEAIKDRMIRNIANQSEKEKNDYYKPVRVRNFWSRNYIECESNGGRNKTLSIEEYVNKIRPHLKDIIKDF